MINRSIVRWAHSPFGKLSDQDVEALIARVAPAVMKDAGIEPDEVEAAFYAALQTLKAAIATAGIDLARDRLIPATRRDARWRRTSSFPTTS